MDIIRSDYSIKNPELKKATNYILDRARNIKENVYRIAATLYRINADELYTEDGFESVIEYSEKVLGLKKSQTYNLLNIAEYYIDPDNMAHSIFYDDQSKDFNKSQLIAMLPLGYENSVELVTDKVITPEMSVRKIKAIVNKRKDHCEDHGEDQDPDPEQDEKMEVITAYGDELFINSDCGIDLQDIYNFIVQKMNEEKED